MVRVASADEGTYGGGRTRKENGVVVRARCV